MKFIIVPRKVKEIKEIMLYTMDLETNLANLLNELRKESIGWVSIVSLKYNEL